jgi:hypothetical protein
MLIAGHQRVQALFGEAQVLNRQLTVLGLEERLPMAER